MDAPSIGRAVSTAISRWPLNPPVTSAGRRRVPRGHLSVAAIVAVDAVSRGDRLDSVKLPKAPIPDPVDKRVTHRFKHRGGKLEVIADVDHHRFRALIDFALGSGRHGQTMIAHNTSGRHRSLRISYYAGVETWELTEKFRPDPVDPQGFLGDLLGDKEFLACLNCHTTRFASFQTPDSPEVHDRGIGCERCHGPCDLHLRDRSRLSRSRWSPARNVPNPRIAWSFAASVIRPTARSPRATPDSSASSRPLSPTVVVTMRAVGGLRTRHLSQPPSERRDESCGLREEVPGLPRR